MTQARDRLAGQDRDDPQSLALTRILARACECGFSKSRLDPYLDEQVAILDRACPTEDDIGTLLVRIAGIVRRCRLPGYFFAYWVQAFTARRQSPYHVLACRLYADAQTSMAEGLAVNSLENAFTALLGERRARGEAGLVPVALTAVSLQTPEATDHPSFEEICAAADRLERAKANPYDYLSADLLVRMRANHDFYRRWSRPFGYRENNPLTENLYWYRTIRELRDVHPVATMPDSQPGGLRFLIDELSSPAQAPSRLVARRMLAARHQAAGETDAAIEQYRLGVLESEALAIDTELGHLRRGLGYAFYAAGKYADAAEQFALAVDVERQSPMFSYWAALSAFELGNARLAAYCRGTDQTAGTLRDAVAAYRDGRRYAETTLAAGVIPVDRSVTQQLLRSYHLAAAQAALLADDRRELVMEIEATAPRDAVELTAEIRAAGDLRLGGKEFRQAAAVFHRHLTSVPSDFDPYLRSLIGDRAARHRYLQARAGQELTAAAARSQSSEQTLDRLLAAGLPGVVLLTLEIGWESTFFTYLVPERRALVVTGQGRFGERDLLAIRQKYVAALAAADQLAEAARPRAVRRALDDLMTACAENLGPVLEAGRPWYQGRQLTILPRLAMMSFPIHAMTVGGRPLIEQCDVSYAPSLAALLAAHRPGDAGPEPTGVRPVLMVHDDRTAPLFAGTAATLRRGYAEQAQVLTRPAWSTVTERAWDRPADLFLACHGRHDPDAPAASCLWLDKRAGVAVTAAQLLAEFDASRYDSVVLGACESGLVRAEVAAEYAGLPLALLAGGVRSVVSSLWRVPQLATAILLSQYFTRRHAPASVPAALSAAQRATAAMSRADVLAWLDREIPEQAERLARPLAQLDPVPFAHPYYWAGFQVTGDV